MMNYIAVLRNILVVALSLASLQAFGQNSFSVSSNLVEIRSTDSILSDSTLIGNLTIGNLQLRWDITELSLPTGWDFYLQDPDSAYTNFQYNANFALPSNATQAPLTGVFVTNGISGAASVLVHIHVAGDNSDDTDVRFTANNFAVGIDNIVAEKSLAYPNPTTALLNLPEHIRFTLYNTTGQKVIEDQNQDQLNMGHLQPGIYLLQLTDPQGKTSMQRICLQ